MTLSVCIELVSSSARVTSVNSAKGVGRSDGHPDPKIGPQVYLGPIKMVLGKALKTPVTEKSLGKATKKPGKLT